MARKFIVVSFKKVRGGISVGEMRQASNAASADKMATAMAPKHVGVAAYSVDVEEESGDMHDPQLIIQFGEIAELQP